MFDKNKKYGVLGMARSGIAAAYKIKNLGGNVFLSELRKEVDVTEAEDLKKNFDCEFGGHTPKLFSCDEWIVSPGIPLNSEIIEQGKKQGIKMISELEFGYQIMHPENVLIAVTGSNGKSTTSSIIAHILNSSGKKCLLAGNIGEAFCSFPIEEKVYDYIVLEVSSFQLDLIDTFKPNIALLLNITPDHLNRYADFKAYALSKFRIFENQDKKQHAILNLDDVVIAGLDSSVKSTRHYFTMDKSDNFRHIPDIWLNDCFIETRTGDLVFSVNDLQIKGPHNWANAMASILACQCAGIEAKSIENSIKTFTALKHRLQFITKIKGVSFFNDSKATNCDSVKYALLSFNQPIRVIMGGSDKGEDFSVLTEFLEKRAKKVYLTGDTADKMRQAWFGRVPTCVVSDFEECVRTAFEDSITGDIVVLSPACASFDKFRNFEHRGDVFIDIVKRIEQEYEKKH